jgi:hypothetical protein
MDCATRQEPERRREMLVAEVWRLDSEKQAQVREVTTAPGLDPLTHTMDGRVAELVRQQNRLISRIQEIDRELGD